MIQMVIYDPDGRAIANESFAEGHAFYWPPAPLAVAGHDISSITIYSSPTPPQLRRQQCICQCHDNNDLQCDVDWGV